MRNNEYYVAELKYTDGSRVELGDAPSYAIVQKFQEDLGDGHFYTRFVNIFSGEEYPAYSRSNSCGQYYYNDRGEEYQIGCRLIQESTEMKKGPCYLLTNERMENISKTDIENMVINSNRYFKDRVGILNRRGKKDLATRRIIFEDQRKQEELLDYFAERDCFDIKVRNNTRGKLIYFRR